MRHELFGKGGGQAVAEFAEAPLLGQIPIDQTVREWGDKGTPVVQAAPESVAAQSFVEIARGAASSAREKSADANARAGHRSERWDGKEEASDREVTLRSQTIAAAAITTASAIAHVVGGAFFIHATTRSPK